MLNGSSIKIFSGTFRLLEFAGHVKLSAMQELATQSWQKSLLDGRYAVGFLCKVDRSELDLLGLVYPSPRPKLLAAVSAKPAFVSQNPFARTMCTLSTLAAAQSTPHSWNCVL